MIHVIGSVITYAAPLKVKGAIIPNPAAFSLRLCVTSSQSHVIYYAARIHIHQAMIEDTTAIGCYIAFYEATIHIHLALVVDNTAALVCCSVPEYSAVYNVKTTFVVVNPATRVSSFISRYINIFYSQPATVKDATAVPVQPSSDNHTAQFDVNV